MIECACGLKNEWWCNDEVNACGIARRKAEIVKGRHGTRQILMLEMHVFYSIILLGRHVD